MDAQIKDGVGWVIAVLVLLTLLLAGAWDLYCLIGGGRPQSTVSAYLTTWSHEWPIGTFFFGVLVGHLLWQVKPFVGG